jgi:hypothetical protein
MRERGISLPALPSRTDDTRNGVSNAATPQLLPVSYLQQWNVALLASCVESVLPELLTEVSSFRAGFIRLRHVTSWF